MGVKITHYDRESGKSHTTVEHVGQVVKTGSTYLGDGDHTFWAIVFNPETGGFDQVHTGWWQVSTIDAPAEVVEAYEGLQSAKLALVRAERAVEALVKAEEDKVWEDQRVRKGKVVKVVKGRKVPKGTIATVKVRCESNWGGYSLLLTLADGTEVWTNESNVEALVESTVEPQPVGVLV